jgi:hypothetical protein
LTPEPDDYSLPFAGELGVIKGLLRNRQNIGAAVLVNLHERPHDGWLEVASASSADSIDGLFHCPCGPIWSIVGQRIEEICDRNDARFEWNALP